METHWYQVETVRKVLKQYRGRVLLADEVGLGKTIEAGMLLKEYILRGMADRVLILTPAALVGQWREEMAEKFGIDCATTHDTLLRTNPEDFWAQKKVIASIAAARRKDHAALLAGNSYDVVVVDEAHHLRDQSSASYRLVNSLQKRFLLLLSATPVQNNLIELYNLLDAAAAGHLQDAEGVPRRLHGPRQTARAGEPRQAARPDARRDGAQHARAGRAAAAAAQCRHVPRDAERRRSRLLPCAGRIDRGPWRRTGSTGWRCSTCSPPPARRPPRPPRRSPASWSAIPATSAGASCCATTPRSGPAPSRTCCSTCCAAIRARRRWCSSTTATAWRISPPCCAQRGMQFASFDGSMSGPDKDAAVAMFRDAVPILLCSESGGEGRNLQFCNTLINFDIPWNPMAIEQRIGRIDRIGQTREVFVFNLATAGTIEDRVLRILDEKINMFELVVGEVGAILGELDEQQDFSTMVLEAWLADSDDARSAAFAELESQLSTARHQYEGAKQLDDALFGNELDAG